MAATGTDNGSMLGAGPRRASKSALERDDEWAERECRRVGLNPTILNKLIMLLARHETALWDN